MDDKTAALVGSKEELKTWLAGHVENTLLYPTINAADIKKFVGETADAGISHICIPITFVESAKREVEEKGLQIDIVTVIGFPHGNEMTTGEKEMQVEDAAAYGAAEVDFVTNIGLFRTDADAFKEEVKRLANAAHMNRMKIKAILETYYLSNREIRDMAHTCELSEIDFIKTSTGFAVKGMNNTERSPDITGADLDAIRVISSGVSQDYKEQHGLKAAGGIRSLGQVKDILGVCGEEGWNVNNIRIGASSGTKIVGEAAGL